MAAASQLPRFNRTFLGGEQTFTGIGAGEIGGKAAGLLRVRDGVLSRLEPDEFPTIDVGIPTLTVLTTELFDDFMSRNNLYDIALSDESDQRIALEFQHAELPAEFVGDLISISAGLHTPLAVRSSSLLEDALSHPFAGVYGTKMIPNNLPDPDTRFHRLVEAIKFVYASTFFRGPKSYVDSVGRSLRDEKMAVIVQEVVGHRLNERFYPAISGVGRSYSYYPTLRAKPEDGVVDLALGLGRQIVDGGLAWTYCPRYPKAPAPYNGLSDLMNNTQTSFWAVNMGKPPPHDPVEEAEYLVQGQLKDAEYDGILDNIVSSYDPASERLRPGLSGAGARVIDFAPVLTYDTLPLNRLVVRLLELSEEALEREVEIEFAVSLDPLGRRRPRFGFLQARPMMVARAMIEIDDDEFTSPDVLAASVNSMGNGTRDDIHDIVYLRPEAFEARHTPAIAAEIATVNRRLAGENRPYLLIGFGRWGSSDPWLGVPVDWAQISGAAVIVEATLPQMSPDLSQGSHFFHNLISFEVLYLSVSHSASPGIDWTWLNEQRAETESDLLRHVRLERPLRVKVDGRNGRGVITHV